MLENGEQWDYDYDAMGQVISGQKKDAAGQPVPGTQFGYAYDGIGNRTSATVNGRTGTYTADTANQYTQRQVPGAVDIRGSASPAAKVTVNGQNTQRLGDSFYKALTVDNSAAPQYPGVSVLAVRQAAGPNGEDVKSETLGNLFLAKTPEVFTHDAEGNLAADGRWNYTWDGENRLTRMETLAAVPAAAKRKLDFAYDAHSRRIRKQVSTWNGSAWVLQSDRRYLYDGWNLVAELDAANTMLRTYTWGLDLSRSPQGAGGVGGLLAIHEGGESYLPAYDGNGNVMALVKASDGSIAARYEYGPFGETLVAQESGISNPFRFSTKFQDGESGLYYYGYRYYDAVTGRWPSRDPIGERGGVNLYGFIGNSATSAFDVLGLFKENTLHTDAEAGRAGSAFIRAFRDGTFEKYYEESFHWKWGGWGDKFYQEYAKRYYVTQGDCPEGCVKVKAAIETITWRSQKWNKVRRLDFGFKFTGSDFKRPNTWPFVRNLIWDTVGPVPLPVDADIETKGENHTLIIFTSRIEEIIGYHENYGLWSTRYSPSYEVSGCIKSADASAIVKTLSEGERWTHDLKAYRGYPGHENRTGKNHNEPDYPKGGVADPISNVDDDGWHNRATDG